MDFSSEMKKAVVEALLKAANSSDGDKKEDYKKVPLLLLKDDPELLQCYKEAQDKKEALFAEAEKLIAELEKYCEVERAKSRKLKALYDQEHDKFWVEFEKKLVEKGVITQEESDRDINLGISDDVLFKKLPVE